MITSPALVVGLMATQVVSRIQANRLSAELTKAEQLINQGRVATAHQKLSDLANQSYATGALLFRLGQCEEMLGRPERALATWSKIHADDPAFVPATESQGSVLINLGRFSRAETLLLGALQRTTASNRYPVLRALARLLRLEGRHDDVSLALTAAWTGAMEPSELLQSLWQNDTEPTPIDALEGLLDSADSNDDRVWLGRARLALLVGKGEDARMWLKRCLERRPNDAPIWVAYLDLAVATDDLAQFWVAADHLADSDLSPVRLQRLRWWLTQHNGDRSAEHREAAKLIERDPSQTQALERLVELALQAGDLVQVEQIQTRKAEIDRAKNAVRKLVVTMSDFQSHAKELVTHSRTQGRTFDQHAWSLIANRDATKSKKAIRKQVTAERFCRKASNQALAQLLTKYQPSPAPPTSTIAHILADLRSARDTIPLDDTQFAHKTPKSPAPKLEFVDDAEASGLQFTFKSGKSPTCFLPESLSGGVGLLDFDGDGWLDVYCVQGGSLMATPGQKSTTESPEPGDRLFRNQQDGTFRDVTKQTGIDRLTWGRGYGQGISIGDFDNDGFPDIFITRIFRYDLFHNRGDGTFEDVTEAQGLAGPRENPTSSAFADLDNDGDLDLYVCHYVQWDPNAPVVCKNERTECFYCDPAKYNRAADRVFRNDRGRFVDTTQSAGFTDVDGHGLGVVAADIDDDNRIDLFVANDGTANYLFRNKGGFQFTDDALTAGVAGNAHGGYQAGMGVAAADLDGDGRIELLVTNLYLEGTTLYQNMGQGMFTDRSTASGIFQSTRYLLGFGIGTIDAGNDGRPDVVITNGNMNDFRPLYPYAMPTRLYEGRPGGRLVDVSDQAGAPWSILRLGRGLATGDLDNDGRCDFLVMGQNEPIAYFHNKTQQPGHFVTFRLEGTLSNRDAVGARVTITTPTGRQVAQRLGGGSYLSASDPRLHFGLDRSTTITSVEVRWPSGKSSRFHNITADTGYLICEANSAVTPLNGFSTRSAWAKPEFRASAGTSKSRASH